MSFEQPKFGPEKKEKNPIIDTRDRYREAASELQRGVAEPQAAKYETTLYRLLERTGNDPELVNAMNEFLGAVDLKSIFGESDKPLPKAELAHITKFFQEKTKELSSPDWNRK